MDGLWRGLPTKLDLEFTSRPLGEKLGLRQLVLGVDFDTVTLKVSEHLAERAPVAPIEVIQILTILGEGRGGAGRGGRGGLGGEGEGGSE